jgi:hypothetical protein
VGCLDENTVAELVARRLPAAEAATANALANGVDHVVE